MKHIVDTHTLIWFVQQDKRLGLQARQVLSDPNSALLLPSVCYGEACWIVEHGRTNIPSTAALKAALDADPRFVVYPLDRAVVERSQSLTVINEMHDRQIMATALVLADAGEAVVVLTRDANMIASGLVPVLW